MALNIPFFILSTTLDARCFSINYIARKTLDLNDPHRKRSMACWGIYHFRFFPPSHPVAYRELRGDKKLISVRKWNEKYAASTSFHVISIPLSVLKSRIYRRWRSSELQMVVVDLCFRSSQARLFRFPSNSSWSFWDCWVSGGCYWFNEKSFWRMTKFANFLVSRTIISTAN